ncbi:MAG TPA: flagellar hook capping FlgD N-terminal domain-containing protein [Nitrospira sp.]|nr:flagellar hook capping FlgD N-terminal domain-containing protein [Nitrospira sp.]
MADSTISSTTASAAQNSSLTAAANSLVSTLPANQQLGDNDFLNLLVTQLQNQDPLKPVDNQDFIAQLAQFSQLQQSAQQVTLLQQLISGQNASQAYSLIPLIGHQVNVAGSSIQLNSGGATLGYSLAANAAAVSVTITDAKNQAVRVLNLGAQGSGGQQVQWNGLDQNGNQVPAGTYQYAVSAVDNNGNKVAATTNSIVTVSGVVPNSGQTPTILAGGQVIDPSTITDIY